MPYLLERGLGLSTGTAGLELMVMPLLLGVTAPIAGRIGETVGVRVLTSGGMVIVAAALVTLGLTGPSIAAVGIGLAFVGVGLGCFTPANNASVLATVPRDQSGEASGVMNVTRATGTSLGLALVGLVYVIGSGDRARVVDVTAGYHDALLFLTAASLMAAVFSLSRPGGQRTLARSSAFE